MDFILAQIQPHPLLFVLCAVLCVPLLWPLAWLLFPSGAADLPSDDHDDSWFGLFFDYRSGPSLSQLFWLLRAALMVGGYCGAVAGLYRLLVRAIA